MKKCQTVETIEVRNNVEFRYLWDVEADTEEEALRIVEDGKEEESHKTDVFSIQIVETSKDGSVWIQDGKEGEQCSVTGDWVKTKQSKVIPYIDKFKYEE
jgi:hypothetical protein